MKKLIIIIFGIAYIAAACSNASFGPPSPPVSTEQGIIQENPSTPTISSDSKNKTANELGLVGSWVLVDFERYFPWGISGIDGHIDMLGKVLIITDTEILFDSNVCEEVAFIMVEEDLFSTNCDIPHYLWKSIELLNDETLSVNLGEIATYTFKRWDKGHPLPQLGSNSNFKITSAQELGIIGNWRIIDYRYRYGYNVSTERRAREWLNKIVNISKSEINFDGDACISSEYITEIWDAEYYIYDGYKISSRSLGVENDEINLIITKCDKHPFSQFFQTDENSMAFWWDGMFYILERLDPALATPTPIVRPTLPPTSE